MIVLAPFLLTVTKNAKQEAWEMIQTQLNGVEANIEPKPSETFCGSIFTTLQLKNRMDKGEWRAH